MPITASAPGTAGAAAPNPTYPAVYVVTLSARTRVAHMRPLFGDEVWARQANGTATAKTTRDYLTRRMTQPRFANAPLWATRLSVPASGRPAASSPPRARWSRTT
ncbi:hypothetical protein EAS64_40650 [Trebonia kvetii]|uniref:Uncharacterized protein n=1 Tax=Trebonia kvetii TaxID=2480626 RepID=A0A6P2BP10_9ACTN|nr:hypothetical protein EAS64_40650 [Trebonia kvetii]